MHIFLSWSDIEKFCCKLERLTTRQVGPVLVMLLDDVAVCFEDFVG